MFPTFYWALYNVANILLNYCVCYCRVDRTTATANVDIIFEYNREVPQGWRRATRDELREYRVIDSIEFDVTVVSSSSGEFYPY